MLLVALLAACATNIHGQYEAERAAVLRELPAPRGEGWAPELEARIAGDTLEALATAALEEGLAGKQKKLSVDNPLGVELSVKPKLKLKQLAVRVGEDCGGCLSVTAALKGSAKWTAGPLSGSVPVSGEVAGQLRFSVAKAGEAWQVSGKVARLDTVKLDRARAAKVDLTGVLGDWTRAALERAPAIELGEFGGGGLPLRALKLDGEDGVLLIQGLAEVPGAVAVGPAPALQGDWDLRLHQDTVNALVRRKAFEAGALAYDTAADPRALRLEGGAFELDLRLWRLAGVGWWRDYTVRGDLGLSPKGKLSLRSTGAEEGAKSKGAGLADPIALLAEGRILDEVGKAVKASVPASRKARVGSQTLRVASAHAEGRSEQLVLSGTLELAGG